MIAERISKRLLAAADLVREGAVLADVGTDHAYLPIYLLTMGKISRAVLSDINEGPLASARANAASSGVSHLVRTRLCDGASELSGEGATDYTILGMGGELIADIIAAAPHLKDPALRIIIQPMSRPEAARRALFTLGFSIKKEVYCTDAGKHYVLMCAEYSGSPESFTEADLHFGKAEHFKKPLSAEGIEYMKEKERVLLKIISGKEAGGDPTDKERELLLALRERIYD